MKNTKSGFLNKRILFQIAILGIILFFGCQQPSPSKTGVAENLVSEDLFPDKINVQHAKHFTVSYHGHYKVVRTGATLGDWDANGSERKDTEDIMVLVQQGTQPPNLTEDLANAHVITIPAKTIASNNATSEIWLEMLGLDKQQVAVGGLKTYNDTTRKDVESGKLGQIRYFWSEPPDMEVLLERNPDILLASISRIDVNQALEKIRALGTPTATIFDWAEKDYLARAEWIKYISLFFNKESQANELYKSIEQKVNELKSLVANSPEKPTVIWGHYVDSGFWMANANNSEARLLKDAGIINLAEDFSSPFNPVGKPFTNEEWLQLGKDADHWIVSTGTTLVRLPSRRYLDGFRAWRENSLYHHYLRSKPKYDVYDWYNLNIVRPDLVLADLIALFHPDLLPNHDFTFLGKYEKDQR